MQSMSHDESMQAAFLAYQKAEYEEKAREAVARKQGMLEGKLETARKLKKMSLTDAQIAEATGLLESEIQAI